MLMQNLGGQTKIIMVFSEVAYALPFDFPQPSTERVSLGKPDVNHAEWYDTSRNSNSSDIR